MLWHLWCFSTLLITHCSLFPRLLIWLGEKVKGREGGVGGGRGAWIGGREKAGQGVLLWSTGWREHHTAPSPWQQPITGGPMPRCLAANPTILWCVSPNEGRDLQSMAKAFGSASIQGGVSFVLIKHGMYHRNDYTFVLSSTKVSLGKLQQQLSSFWGI